MAFPFNYNFTANDSCPNEENLISTSQLLNQVANRIKYEKSLTKTNYKTKMSKIAFTPITKEVTESWASTKLEEESFAFRWQIKNFSSLIYSKELLSPTFQGGPKSKHNWQIRLSSKNGKKLDGAYLILKSFGPHFQSENTNANNNTAAEDSKVKTRFQFSLLDEFEQPKNQTPEHYISEFKINRQLGYDDFIPNEEIVDDTLKFHCKIWIQGELQHEIYSLEIENEEEAVLEEIKIKKDNKAVSKLSVIEYETSEEVPAAVEESVKNLQMFSEQMKNSLKDDDGFSDFTISTQSKKFKVHKIILSSRSSVFKSILTTNASEIENEIPKKDPNVLEINEFDSEVVEAMLEYIYSGQLNFMNAYLINIENLEQLSQLANIYDLPLLKIECERAILDKRSEFLEEFQSVMNVNEKSPNSQ